MLSPLHKKAQNIVNEVDKELGIALVAFSNTELEYLQEKLKSFLALEVDTDELHDADDDDFVDEDEDEDEDENFNYDEEDNA